MANGIDDPAWGSTHPQTGEWATLVQWLHDNGLHGVHIETRESEDGGWKQERHTGYVARACTTCKRPFIGSSMSDATTCAGHQE